MKTREITIAARLMFYALIATYHSHDLILDDETELCGPYATLEDLDAGINALELDTEEQTHNVTVLQVHDSKLVRVYSEILEESGCEMALTIELTE